MSLKPKQVKTCIACTNLKYYRRALCTCDDEVVEDIREPVPTCQEFVPIPRDVLRGRLRIEREIASEFRKLCASGVIPDPPEREIVGVISTDGDVL